MVKSFFTPGDLCGSYKIIRLMGQGAFGQVYEAKRLGTTTRMALKCIGLGGVEGDLMKRLVLETEALQSLDHPNIVCMEDAGLNDGVFWIALTYIEGQTLHDLIRRGPLTIVKALGIAGQIADGAGAAHARGVVHRDLKPQNIMITPEGGVKILDFGAAKILGAELTAQGGIAPASPLYMAPEQIQGRAVDGRTDMYALGIILHQMLAGKHPYASASGKYPPIETIAALHLHSALDRIKGVPEFVFDIIAKATACDPAERFQSMEEVADAIRASLRRVMDDPAMVWAHASSGPSSGVPGARIIELFPGRAKPRLHVPQPPPPAKPDTSPPTLRVVAEAEHDKVEASDSDVLATRKWIPALVVSRPEKPTDGPMEAEKVRHDAAAWRNASSLMRKRLAIVAPLFVVVLFIWNSRWRSPTTSMEAHAFPLVIALPPLNESIPHEEPAPPPTRISPPAPRHRSTVNSRPSSPRTATVHGEQVELCGVYYCQRKGSK